MNKKTLNDFSLSRPEFDQPITIREAYLAMFDFLDKNWSGCLDYELGTILGTLSVWDTTEGEKAPMDVAILPEFLAAVERVRKAENGKDGYSGADIQFKK